MLKLVPRISEQTYQMSEDKNTYVFMVPTSANKLDIKKAVEEKFKNLVRLRELSVKVVSKLLVVEATLRKHILPLSLVTKLKYLERGSNGCNT